MINGVLLVLISHFLFLTNGMILDENTIIKDGLILSYWLKNGEGEKIENYFLTKGFLEEKNNNSYYQYLDEKKKEVLIIIKDKNNKAISITHFHFEKETKFTDAVRSKLLESVFFKQGSNDNVFLFSLSENDSYQYQSKIMFNNEVILFVVPSIASEDIDWVNIIRELTL